VAGHACHALGRRYLVKEYIFAQQFDVRQRSILRSRIGNRKTKRQTCRKDYRTDLTFEITLPVDFGPFFHFSSLFYTACLLLACH
jgi:hypothetical protein